MKVEDLIAALSPFDGESMCYSADDPAASLCSDFRVEPFYRASRDWKLSPDAAPSVIGIFIPSVTGS